MEEESRNLPFECRGCWHVWEEEYLVRHVDDRHGNETHIWMRFGVRIPPPSSGAVCPECGSQEVTTFPEGYLGHHPELKRPAVPAALDPTPLLSPVRPRWAGL